MTTLREHLEAIRRECVRVPDDNDCIRLHVMEYAERSLGILDAAHRDDAHGHGDGLVVIPDTPGGSA